MEGRKHGAKSVLGRTDEQLNFYNIIFFQRDKNDGLWELDLWLNSYNFNHLSPWRWLQNKPQFHFWCVIREMFAGDELPLMQKMCLLSGDISGRKETLHTSTMFNIKVIKHWIDKYFMTDVMKKFHRKQNCSDPPWNSHLCVFEMDNSGLQLTNYHILYHNRNIFTGKKWLKFTFGEQFLQSFLARKRLLPLWRNSRCDGFVSWEHLVKGHLVEELLSNQGALLDKTMF